MGSENQFKQRRLVSHNTPKTKKPKREHLHAPYSHMVISYIETNDNRDAVIIKESIIEVL